ncbi:Regulatory protein RecX [Paraburkholderia graminis C4D1M]|uniref:Regulatory protein RecX n=1 Tax=Paraburkholderia graminis (strain ATCC 700544 / DSM 17151 / LMG 18924 / NCIMB 13744 / C4D1M) TaxID=396598 RepID=B1G227_PARG4|nr:regulatory protein RecX [Paraburkholderia graminis C4D1M]CAB3701940.1 Regulatory protein RecX [Paraburkholderia graminis C4D1M]
MGGPRNDGSDSPERSAHADLSETSDRFDPFDRPEPFDAHDRAAGRGLRRALLPGQPDQSAEATYTRSSESRGSRNSRNNSRSSLRSHGSSGSRSTSASDQTPGDADPAPSEAKKSQRPARSLKGRALGYLSRREYSRSELARKLKPFVEESDSLDTLLDTLESENWLSDSRFAESLIHRRSSRLGASRIVGELKQHAVDRTLVDEASAQLRETELARAQAVWRKKFGQLPETAAERAKQARFLASRGFSGATIGKILKGIDEEWSGE